MTSASDPITESDILAAVVDAESGDLPIPAARALMSLGFKKQAVDRMNELAERNCQGRLTPAEQSELEKYLRVGSFLNLIRAKAKLTLASTEPNAS